MLKTMLNNPLDALMHPNKTLSVLRNESIYSIRSKNIWLCDT